MAEESQYRRVLFERIKNARTKAEAQELALRLWHDMNATQEGFVCPGCSNCELAEDCVSDPHRKQP